MYFDDLDLTFHGKRKLSKINFYQHQTLSNIKLDQYKQLFNQQKSSRPSREGSDRAIIFHVKSRTESPTVQTKELRIRFFFFSLLYIGAGPVWVVSGGQPKLLFITAVPSKLWVKAEWPVGRPVANLSKGSCPKSTSINIRPFQTSK